MTNKKAAVKLGKKIKVGGVDHVTAMQAGKMLLKKSAFEVAEYLESQGYKVEYRDIFGDDHQTVYTVNGVSF